MVLRTTMRISKARPYSRPVRHILLTLCLIALAWLGPLARDVLALDLKAQKTLVNKGVIGVLGDGARGNDFAMIADLAALLRSLCTF